MTAPMAALALLLGAVGCAEDAADEPRFTDPEQPVEVEVGETFVLEQYENPTTGFVWEILDPAPDSGVIRAAGDDYVSDEPQLDGTGGVRLLRFEAVAEGETTVSMAKFRGEQAGGREIAFEITVTAPADG
ncbi:protease inhibitor I42 family protein [Streptomyces sp. DSM 44915]|uniref:Protease inhibitor I42 family protein n=1 Tax=Streptomyces chisholmiae TaxID=3075540 RepID=A0ABU2JZK1_9ACTN|nr:protease inhibitor I42 family protein [Streptomyces sp. DSM 44915]